MDRHVLVIGAGRMGIQIGLEYAMAGFHVRLVARDVAALEARLDQTIALWGELLEQDCQALHKSTDRLECSNTLEAIDSDLEVAVESLPEDLGIKVAALRPLVAAHPETIIATNTSSLSISSLGSAIDAPAKTIGVHYLNPPYLNPLVEVIPGALTDTETTNRVLGLVSEMGKRAILVREELPGFIWNRLQFALLREAVDLVERGAASAEDVEAVMELGLGRRWRAVGPLKSVVLGGIETFRSAAPRILASLSAREELDSLAVLAEELQLDGATTARERDWVLAKDLVASKDGQEWPDVDV